MIKTRRNKERTPLPPLTQPHDPKIDEMTKNLKDLTSEIANLKWESKQPNRAFQGVGNINPN
jgi:hypothetical protein